MNASYRASRSTRSSDSAGIGASVMPNVGRVGSQRSKLWIGKLEVMPPSLNRLICKSSSANRVRATFSNAVGLIVYSGMALK
jgi:hypothetical protein